VYQTWVQGMSLSDCVIVWKWHGGFYHRAI